MAMHPSRRRGRRGARPGRGEAWGDALTEGRDGAGRLARREWQRGLAGGLVLRLRWPAVRPRGRSRRPGRRSRAAAAMAAAAQVVRARRSGTAAGAMRASMAAQVAARAAALGRSTARRAAAYSRSSSSSGSITGSSSRRARGDGRSPSAAIGARGPDRRIGGVEVDLEALGDLGHGHALDVGQHEGHRLSSSMAARASRSTAAAWRRELLLEGGVSAGSTRPGLSAVAAPPWPWRSRRRRARCRRRHAELRGLRLVAAFGQAATSSAARASSTRRPEHARAQAVERHRARRAPSGTAQQISEAGGAGFIVQRRVL